MRTAPVFAQRQHLVLARRVERIEQRRPAARTQLVDSLVQQVDVVGKSLLHVRLHVEALHERAVVAVQHLQQERDRRVLLELEPLPDRAAGVQHDPHPQRQARLLVEVQHRFRRPSVIQQPKVSTGQPRDELPVLVRHGKDQVHLVGIGPDHPGRRILRRRCRWIGLRLRLCRRRWCRHRLPLRQRSCSRQHHPRASSKK